MKIKLTKIKILIGLVALMVVGAIVFQTMYKRNTAAYVNGTRILVGPIDSRVNSMKKRDPGRFKRHSGVQEAKRLRRMFLDEQIARVTIGQSAVKAGIKVSDKEVENAINELRSRYKSSAAFDKQLKSEGTDVEYLRSLFRNTIAGAKMKAKLAKNIKVSKIEVDDYTKKNRAKLEKNAPQVKLTVLAVEDDEVKQTVKLLKASGGFESAAKKIGIEPVDFGWHQESGFDKNVMSALSKINVGEYTTVIPNPNNTFSVYLLEDRQSRKSSPKEISKQVETTLLRRKQQNVFGAWFKGIQKKTDVQVFI